MPGQNEVFCHTLMNENVLNPLLLPSLQVAARVTLVQGQNDHGVYHHEHSPPPRLWELTSFPASAIPSTQGIYCHLHLHGLQGM